jgi:hypothetical protein
LGRAIFPPLSAIFFATASKSGTSIEDTNAFVPRSARGVLAGQGRRPPRGPSDSIRQYLDPDLRPLQHHRRNFRFRSIRHCEVSSSPTPFLCCLCESRTVRYRGRARLRKFTCVLYRTAQPERRQ